MNFLKKLLPWIGAAASAVAAGGPIGLLQVAAQGIGAIVGKTDLKADPQAIAMAVAGATPDQQLQMQKLDNDFAITMKQLGFQNVEELEKIAADDRANARQREVETRDWFPKALAAIVCVLCFLGEGLYFIHGTPPNVAPELVGRILGTLDSALILVLSYYFGSSYGSDRKTDIMAQGKQ